MKRTTKVRCINFCQSDIIYFQINKMRYLISQELDNNEYSKCFSYKSRKFCALKILQIIKKKLIDYQEKNTIE
ncbi:hypothetical protein V1478_016930 [Vespula squamosa]|uniref:Uncharacterized protein n=1 Tax=Vespula squamosa TaxID=30214 RepID=A0ABD1ZYG3_VESSQ